jgi:hypothetical protein
MATKFIPERKDEVLAALREAGAMAIRGRHDETGAVLILAGVDRKLWPKAEREGTGMSFSSAHLCTFTQTVRTQAEFDALPKAFKDWWRDIKTLPI